MCLRPLCASEPPTCLTLIWEARLLGVRHLFPLAVAALVQMLTACASVFEHPIGSLVSALTSCLYDSSRAIDRLLNSNLDAIITHATEEREYQRI